MIKVGISGGESMMAGDLLRLLVLHPEVDLIAVSAPSLRGKTVSNYHHGLIGETELRFVDTLNLEELDLLFVASERFVPTALPSDLKVISFLEEPSVISSIFNKEGDLAPAVSEMFRKQMVRHARGAYLLMPPLSVAIIVLFPLALHLLLNDSLKIKVSLPKYRRKEFDITRMGQSLIELLSAVQLSFSKIESIEALNSSFLKTLCIECEFNTGTSKEEIDRIYGEIYDDHNFTFIVRNDPAPTEVGGTQKCFLHVSKPTEDTVRIKAVADSFMRGGAGDAIHAMNLLFGLHEKTGLSLPASMAFKHTEIEPEEI